MILCHDVGANSCDKDQSCVGHVDSRVALDEKVSDRAHEDNLCVTWKNNLAHVDNEITGSVEVNEDLIIWLKVIVVAVFYRARECNVREIHVGLYERNVECRNARTHKAY